MSVLNERVCKVVSFLLIRLSVDMISEQRVKGYVLIKSWKKSLTCLKLISKSSKTFFLQH